MQVALTHCIIQLILHCRPMKNTISGSEGRGFMKIVVDTGSDRVVGMHMVGPDSAEILQVSSSLTTLIKCSGWPDDQTWLRPLHQLRCWPCRPLTCILPPSMARAPSVCTGHRLHHEECMQIIQRLRHCLPVRPVSRGAWSSSSTHSGMPQQ